MNESSKCALLQAPDELLQGNRGAATEFLDDAVMRDSLADEKVSARHVPDMFG